MILKIALDTPLNRLFDYTWTSEDTVPAVGQLAIVPFGRREVAGLIVEVGNHTELPPEKIRSAIAIRTEVAPLSTHWLALCAFAAEYYQRPLGEVLLPALPKQLRSLKPGPITRAYKRLAAVALAAPTSDAVTASAAEPNVARRLNADQTAAVEAICEPENTLPVLLFGVTGSGKTEVYMQATAKILARSPAAQILMLVPEINLTPQLLESIRERFPGRYIAAMHSGLAEGERLAAWLAAHSGQAQIVIGTRLAITASMPSLAMIIVDEEHDASYKQQEGLRYSARDLAIWRAHQLKIPVVLGSATPSLESWQHADTGRYRKLSLRERAVPDAVLPEMQLIDMERDKPVQGMTAALLAALRRRLEQGEQSLLFLNRRGYAPVLNCDACGWVSDCKRCTAFLVLHKPEQRLRCHHCSLELRIPRSCPTCGNVDLQPMGRGTQRIEEQLQALFPAARLLRIDADSTRLKGAAQAAFDTVHRGEVDILIGTQMVAKGHDFKHLTLVGALNPDTALFSHDFRASERLFSQLMQVAGRAGRTAQKDGANPPQVLIQTRYPRHPLYAALAAHDYQSFAVSGLLERRQAGLPPFIYQSLLRAEAPRLDDALAFLQQAAAGIEVPDGIVIHDPIPMTMTRVANVERAQMLVESTSRPALQAFLKSWVPWMRETRTRIRWSLEVDPAEI